MALVGRLAAMLALSAGLALAQQTGITGRLTDASNRNVANVVVSAIAEDGTKAAALTNAKGVYRIAGVRAANYVLRFRAPGFAPVDRALTVTPGQIATVDVALQPATSATVISVAAATAPGK